MIQYLTRSIAPTCGATNPIAASYFLLFFFVCSSAFAKGFGGPP